MIILTTNIYNPVLYTKCSSLWIAKPSIAILFSYAINTFIQLSFEVSFSNDVLDPTAYSSDILQIELANIGVCQLSGAC